MDWIVLFVGLTGMAGALTPGLIALGYWAYLRGQRREHRELLMPGLGSAVAAYGAVVAVLYPRPPVWEAALVMMCAVLLALVIRELCRLVPPCKAVCRR